MIPINSPEQSQKARDYEVNRSSFGRLQAEGTGGQVFEEGAIKVWSAPFIHPFNGLMSPDWKEKERMRNLRRAVQLYQQTGKGMFVSLGPASQPDVSYRSELKRLGFGCSYHVPFMHLDLSLPRKKDRSTLPVRVERLTNFKNLAGNSLPWLGPLTTAHRKSKFSFLEKEVTARQPRLWQFVVWHEEKIVGGARVFRHLDTAGIYDVEVSPEFRRKGIGTQLMLTACDFARRQGLRSASLSASKLGIGLYLKTGFTEAGHWSDWFMGGSRLAQLKF